MVNGPISGWRQTWPAALLGLVALAFVAVSCGSDNEASLEARAQSIDKNLICPVCPGETIDQARVELAGQMRAVVREKLAEGWSRQQIFDFFVDRYGESVLAAPPKGGFGLVVWLVPLAAVPMAGVLLLFVIRAMRRGGAVSLDEGIASEGDLEPYLSLVDEDLGISHEATPEGQVGRASEPQG